MEYPAKGKPWSYIGTLLMIASIVVFIIIILSTLSTRNYEILSNAYFLFCSFFLSAGIFRIYAITPLMKPKFAVIVILVILAASQTFNIFTAFGLPLIGFIVGHFTELGAFSWAYSKSEAMYLEKPL